MIDGAKYCPRCKQTKPISEYRFNLNGKRKGNIRSYCKLCEKEWSFEWRLRTGRSKTRKNTHPVVNGMKFCSDCNQAKSVNEFYVRHGDREGELYDTCKACKNKRVTECGHESGRWKPMSENKDCSNYLGVHIAERVLSAFFDRIERMPFGNPGYDFLCGRGFEIDVKSSCLRPHVGGSPYWGFNIRRNLEADYFLCLAFDDRASLEPQHVWLFPSSVVNGRMVLNIPNISDSLAKWSKYERSLDKVQFCCDVLREAATE